MLIPEGQGAVAVAVDVGERCISVGIVDGETSASITFRPDEPQPVKARIVAEGTIVEMFANDRYSPAACVPAPLARMTIGLEAEEPFSFTDIAVYWLATLDERKEDARQ